jgi:3-deoxy-D-manno-octulosonic-acid transferase
MPVLLNALYLAALTLLSPWLLWRSLRTGRYRRDLRAKLTGGVPEVPPGEPVTWFHGVSVGEIHLLVTLVAAYRRRHPTRRVVVSSTTDAGLAEARKAFGDCVVVPYPFDFSWAARRAISRLRPSLIVLAESELWPNFLAVAAGEGVPVAVVNGRTSPRSFARLQRVAGLARRLLFRHLRLLAVQSDDYAERLRLLGVPAEKLVVTGSIKYDGAAAGDPAKTVALRQLLALSETTPVLVAGSTHAPEEQIVLGVFRTLRETVPDLRLILVPRHPDRFTEVAGLVGASGFAWARRSDITASLDACPAVVLLDTVGELGAAWGLATVGFTGGSLDGKRGAQSMIEPAGRGVPVAFGPHVWNFRDAARSLIKVGGAVMVQDAAELRGVLLRWLTDEAARHQAGAAATSFVRAQQGATQRTLDALDGLRP